MQEKIQFRKSVLHIALPIVLQSLLQASFSVVDQVMTGQLGTVSIAGIGLGSKFVSLYTALISAVAAAAGIMISQYIGQKEEAEVGRSFYLNLSFALLLALLFWGAGCIFPERIMSLYSNDEETVRAAAAYLRVVSFSFLPAAAGSIFSTLLRCREAARLPLYASIFSAVLNTLLNYVLIFGKLGFPALGVVGAACATVAAQTVSFVLTGLLYKWYSARTDSRLRFALRLGRAGAQQYAWILAPVLANELLWSLGENVYTVIYGHISTEACAAMTLTIPVQALTIGVLSGLSSAAGILIGKRLGRGEYEEAYREAGWLIGYGLAGALAFSALVFAGSRMYVNIYRVEEQVRQITVWLLGVFALFCPVKVLNMVVGGGILRSGGKTKYVMAVDIFGTWVFGVPAGLLAAFVWKLPIAPVYFLLSLEECVRLGMNLWIFKRRIWMRSLEKSGT